MNLSMMSNISFANIEKCPLEIQQNLNSSLTILSDFFGNVLLDIVHTMSVTINCLAILFCYIYLKNFRHHSMILVDGYISIFKIFAEYISATVCVCYGLLEMDRLYLSLGTTGIVMGLCLKALLLYQQRLHQNKDTFIKFATRGFSGLYLICIFVCCSAFHDITMKVGALSCATRVLTSVVPLVALSDNFRTEGEVFASLCTDLLAVTALWWHCSQLSFKYFIVVPSIIGLIFTFIRYVLEEIQKAASEEIETDLYST